MAILTVRTSKSYDIDADQVHGRKSAHVMGEPDPGIFDLSVPGLPLKLLVHLIHHPETRCTNGVPEALETPVRLTRDLAVAVEKPIPHVISGLPTRGDPKVLIGYQICDVDLGGRSSDYKLLKSFDWHINV